MQSGVKIIMHTNYNGATNKHVWHCRISTSANWNEQRKNCEKL